MGNAYTNNNTMQKKMGELTFPTFPPLYTKCDAKQLLPLKFLFYATGTTHVYTAI